MTEMQPVCDWVGTLDGGISATATSLSVNAVTDGNSNTLPDRDFILLCGKELIHVSVRSGVVCSGLTRGYDGSDAVAHLTAAYVAATGDAGNFARRIADYVAAHEAIFHP